MNGDLEMNWKRFRQSFEMVLLATGICTKESAIQAAILKHVIGEEALQIIENLELDDADTKDIKILTDALDKYFNPMQNKS